MLQTLNPEELVERAHSLRDRAKVSGTFPVAILAGNGMGALVGRRLANILRAPLVPVNPLLRSAEIAHILRDSQATHLFCEESLIPQAEAAIASLEKHAPRLITLREPELRAGDVLVFEGAKHANLENDEIGATLIYTSGTTGNPKGCYRTAAQEAARARELVATYSVTNDDVQLISCPLAHSAPGIFARAAHAVCARSIILPRFDVDAFRRAWDEFDCSFFFLVPTQYRRLLIDSAKPEQLWIPPASTRAALVAGAPLSHALREGIQSWLGPNKLWQFYGSTETGTISIAAPGFAEIDGVGRLAPQVEVQVRDTNGCPCAPGTLGEMYIRSPTVMSGYWPAKTRDADGFVTVGDLGYITEAGTLHLVDRKNDTIITGGVNVYPAEVESALLALDGVDAAVVVGLPDDDWGQRVVALVASATVQSAESLRAACRSSLATYKVPKRIYLHPFGEMPVGASGKALRRHAREILLEYESTSVD